MSTGQKEIGVMKGLPKFNGGNLPDFLNGHSEETQTQWLEVYTDQYEVQVMSGVGVDSAEQAAFQEATDVAVNKEKSARFAEMIKQEGGKWILYSKDGKKKLGTFGSQDEALKRERQIQFMKNAKFQESTFHILESVDPEGKEWDVVLIEAGKAKKIGSHGFPRFYSEEVLQEAVDAGMFENGAVRIYEQSGGIHDHLPENLLPVQSGFIKNQVGITDNSRIGEFTKKDGTKGRGVLAKFHVLEGHNWLRAAMKDLWNKGKKVLGFSIDGGGKETPKFHNGETVDWVERFFDISENTLVSHPAAGGGILRLAASINEKQQENDKMREKLIAKIKEKFPRLLESAKIEDKSDEDLLEMYETALREAKEAEDKKAADVKAEEEKKAVEAKKVEEEKTEQTKSKTDGLDKQIEATEAKVAKMQESIELSTCQAVLKTRLAEAQLPQPITTMLSEKYSGKQFEVDELNKEISAQQEMVTKLRETKPNVGPQIKVGKEERDKHIVAMDGFFAGEDQKDKDGTVIPMFHSFREAYAEIVQDPRAYMADARTILADAYSFAPDMGDDTRLAESYDRERRIAFRETGHVTSTWAQILGDSVTRRMVKLYDQEEYQDYRKIASSIVPINDFRTQRRLHIGGFGTLSTVAEQGTYLDLGNLGDEEDTYAPAKKGGLASVTEEMVANDDVNAIRNVPVLLGNAAGLTLKNSVFDMFKNNLEQDASTTLATSARGNKGTTALGSGEWATMRTRMRTLTAYGNTSDYLGAANVPRVLMVPNELEEIALKLQKSDIAVNAVVSTTAANNYQHATEPNLYKGQIDVIVVDEWTDADNWWVVANPKKAPTLEVGFYKGRQKPELFVQDNPTVGSMFTADKITYKIRFIYGFGILNWRAFGGAIV